MSVTLSLVFSGLPLEVKSACVFFTENEDVDVINNRRSELGEWLWMSRSLEKQEADLKAFMPEERKKFQKKTVPDAENYPGRPYDDKDLAADLEKGFQLSGTLSCYFDGFVSYAHRVWLTTLKLLYASCWIYRAVCLIWRGRRVMTSHNLSKL